MFYGLQMYWKMDFVFLLATLVFVLHIQQSFTSKLSNGKGFQSQRSLKKSKVMQPIIRIQCDEAIKTQLRRWIWNYFQDRVRFHTTQPEEYNRMINRDTNFLLRLPVTDIHRALVNNRIYSLVDEQYNHPDTRQIDSAFIDGLDNRRPVPMSEMVSTHVRPSRLLHEDVDVVFVPLPPNVNNSDAAEVATAFYTETNADGTHNYEAHCLVTGFNLLP